MHKKLWLMVLLALIVAVPGQVLASVMYGADSAGNYFSLNTGTGAATLIGPLGGPAPSTEIEYEPLSGQAFQQDVSGSGTMNPFNINTGAPTGPTVFTFDSGTGFGLDFNGLEYVGPTLYGDGITAVGVAGLYTLNPLTGSATLIGPAAVRLPMSGLAYDGITMYGIDGGGGGSLYTVNTATGVATPVGPTGIVAESLEFGPGGQLFAGGDLANTGNLYTINTGTGAATLVGPTGLGTTISGLAFDPGAPPIPEASTYLLFGLGALGLMAWRKRKAR